MPSGISAAGIEVVAKSTTVLAERAEILVPVGSFLSLEKIPQAGKRLISKIAPNKLVLVYNFYLRIIRLINRLRLKAYLEYGF